MPSLEVAVAVAAHYSVASVALAAVTVEQVQECTYSAAEHYSQPQSSVEHYSPSQSLVPEVACSCSDTAWAVAAAVIVVEADWEDAVVRTDWEDVVVETDWEDIVVGSVVRHSRYHIAAGGKDAWLRRWDVRW